MATENKLAARLREFSQRRGARSRGAYGAREGGSEAGLRSAVVQPVETQAKSLPSDSAPFKLPAAYSNSSVASAVNEDKLKPPLSPAPQGQGSRENRCSKRKVVKLSGILKNTESSLDIDVLVKDMSVNGVCLVVDRENPNRQLPSQNPHIAEVFQLSIPFDKMSVQCKLIWRDGDMFGAAFNSTPVFQR